MNIVHFQLHIIDHLYREALPGFGGSFVDFGKLIFHFIYVDINKKSTLQKMQSANDKCFNDMHVTDDMQKNAADKMKNLSKTERRNLRE